MCQLAKEGLTQPPKRRFAMNILRYATKPGSFEVQEPFVVTHTVWRFTDQLFSQIADAAETWKDHGGLQRHDILLGPCTNEGFQKADFNVSPDGWWTKSDAYKKAVIDTYKSQRLEDLSIALGQDKDDRRLDEDIKLVRDGWRQVKVIETRGSGESAAAFTEGIDNLLDSVSPAAATEAPKAAPASSVDDLFGGTAVDAEGWATEVDAETASMPTETFTQVETVPEVTAEEIPVEEVKVTPIPATTPKDDLDDLLSGL
jgi:hypothetical protein